MAASPSSTPTVAIVGAGFGGIGLGIRLREAGIESFTILEKGDGIGGVWRDNSYPGLTCDIPSHLYSFSFEPKHDWSRRFPLRDEILVYLEHCVAKHRLRGHIRLGTEVASADFDEASGRWRIVTTEGERLEADVLVSATGQLSRPAYPEIPGLERFEGESFHSARWNHDYELDGKRVAVIGTGATAIQFVPEIASRVERLLVFQRSAPWVVPKPDRPYRDWEQNLYRRVPWIQELSRLRIHLLYEVITLALTRMRWMGRLFERGYRRRLEREVPDPRLRDRLMPHYPIGCKRILLSDEWLQTLARPDVELVTGRIAEVTPTGIVAEGGAEHGVDAIILATGFASTEFLAPMAIRGLGGTDLNETWRDGAEAYLGLAVSGFPNMFILYGPNTNLGAGSVIDILESQIEHVVEAVGRLHAAQARYLEVRPDVQTRFNAEIQRRLEDSVWTAGCSNWYRAPNGKVVNNWPGGAAGYMRRARRLEIADYVVVPATRPRGGAESSRSTPRAASPW
jgi:cation diffusion facilitator CzcD-associated flavoprotein CzcO